MGTRQLCGYSFGLWLNGWRSIPAHGSLLVRGSTLFSNKHSYMVLATLLWGDYLIIFIPTTVSQYIFHILMRLLKTILAIMFSQLPAWVLLCRLPFHSWAEVKHGSMKSIPKIIKVLLLTILLLLLPYFLDEICYGEGVSRPLSYLFFLINLTFECGGSSCTLYIWKHIPIPQV